MRTPTVIENLLRAQRIAVVGLSSDASQASFQVASFLREHGKEIIPVNPTIRQWQDLKSYPSLADVPGPIDLVNVFRRREYCAQVAKEAVAAKAGGLWLQSGIRNAEARAVAQAANLPYVEDRCIMVELSMSGHAAT